MPSIRINDVPPQVYEGLRRRANEHRRTLEDEALAILAVTAAEDPRDPGRLLKELDEIRDRLNLPPVTDEFIRNARLKGRS